MPDEVKLLPCAQDYALGLLVEEMAEASAMIGKALRFGIDTPGPSASPYHGSNARQLLETELGDVLAAIEYATIAGVVEASSLTNRMAQKLTKLMNPESRDNLGRRLAPDPVQANTRAIEATRPTDMEVRDAE